MIIKHHPEDELLLDYVAGGLGEAASIAVAVHLVLCPECRRQVNFMESVGGSLLEGLPEEKLEDDVFGNVMKQINSDMPSPHTTLASDDTNQAGVHAFPGPLTKYLTGDGKALQWRRLGFGIHQVVLPSLKCGAGARLLRIEGGKSVPSHSHYGLELTLVLSGSFYDQTGRYARGDLQVADETTDHAPCAERGADCICLAVTEGALRFNSFAAKLVQPLVGI